MQYYPAPEEVIEMDDLIAAVRTAFTDHGEERCVMPPKVYVDLPGGDFRTMPSYLPSLNVAGVKVVNVHPDNPTIGLPTVMSMTILLDPPTGKPIAVLNTSNLTALRTGASAAVATSVLAPKKKGIVGIIGSGRQAMAGLMALNHVFEPMEVRVWSRSMKHAERFASQFPNLPVQVVELKKAADADVLLTVTPSEAPLISDEWIAQGTHINAMGADARGKQELDPAILSRAEVFVDDLMQAVHSGEINVPISTGIYHPEQVAGTLGEVITGKISRSSPDAITVFDSTGIAITDLAVAHLALGKGTIIDLPFPDNDGIVV
ncbi:ornithine cyclodeaminase family protein [Methanospirillum stamsii]|uniref:Alanine dehydrogenase n=1 Tax=Methanospirillum stamsii TaxID=1277351 RepID=A0A2V2N427_9EURY|nr:ornithine cyclodeaminase family protein [Methanospirillum stamsii]PWR72486.1 ornithine cyclodeaminase family protein [Methanospirillum stamsii]